MCAVNFFTTMINEITEYKKKYIYGKHPESLFKQDIYSTILSRYSKFVFIKLLWCSFMAIVARMSDVAPGPLVSRSDSFFQSQETFVYIHLKFCTFLEEKLLSNLIRLLRYSAIYY